VRLEQGTHPGMVGFLRLVVPERPAEQRGLPGAGSAGRVRVRAAEPRIGQQPLHLLIAGDQPRRVTGRGADLVDRAPGLQRPQLGRGLQRVRLLERQLDEGRYVGLLVYYSLYTSI
jgi:hypothetical protein